MGMLGSLFGKKPKPKKQSKQKQPGADALVIKFVKELPTPKIDGVGSFLAEPICGFDLSHTPWREGFHGTEILMDGANRRKVIEDCFSLQKFFMEAADYDKTFPLELDASFHDLLLPSIELHPNTPTGKAPKYPASVHMVIDAPAEVPENWDLWWDVYARAGKAEQARMDKHLEESRRTDSIVGHISYLPDGSIGKADFYFWKKKLCFAASVRMKAGELYLSKASRKKLEDEKETVTFKA